MKRLAQRERRLVGLAGGAVLLFLLYQFALNPLLNYYDRMKREIPKMEMDLLKAGMVRIQYMALDRQIREIRGRLDRRAAEFNPHDFLSTLAKNQGILGNLDKIQLESKEANDNYQEQIASVRLKNISLDKLVNYLSAIEHSDKLITVKELSIKPDNQNSLALDVKFDASTFVKVKKREGANDKKPPSRKPRPPRGRTGGTL